MVLTAMTPVLTAAVGVAINLATDGKHSWWAWVLVGMMTAAVVVAVWLARRQDTTKPTLVLDSDGDSGSDAVVDARGGQGFQFGDHNTQTNTFTHRPPA
jgi:hypothetical protein